MTYRDNQTYLFKPLLKSIRAQGHARMVGQSQGLNFTLRLRQRTTLLFSQLKFLKGDLENFIPQAKASCGCFPSAAYNAILVCAICGLLFSSLYEEIWKFSAREQLVKDSQKQCVWKWEKVSTSILSTVACHGLRSQLTEALEESPCKSIPN